MEEKPQIQKPGFFTSPLSRQGWPRWLVFVMGIIGVVYILNPTAGIIELLPDNIPLVGNIDEGVAWMLVWFGLTELFEGKSPTSPWNHPTTHPQPRRNPNNPDFHRPWLLM